MQHLLERDDVEAEAQLLGLHKATEPCRAKTLLGPAPAISDVIRHAHALKHDLATVKTIVELLEPELDGKAWERIERCRAAVSRMQRIVAQDLGARPHEEVVYHEVGPESEVEAGALVEQVRRRLRDRAEAKHVDVLVYCSCSLVRVQATAFSQALYDLLDNAIEATRTGYPVTIDVRTMENGDVLWQIADSGEGLSAPTLAALGQAQKDQREDGSGLGVSIARSIIDKHGGLLRFESAPGVGTTATIWLPGAAVTLPAPRRSA